jgi:hypothetical protein
MTTGSHVNAIAELQKELNKMKDSLIATQKKAVIEYDKEVAKLKVQIKKGMKAAEDAKKKLEAARKQFNTMKDAASKAAHADAELAAKAAHEMIQSSKDALKSSQHALSLVKSEWKKTLMVTQAEAKVIAAIAKKEAKATKKKPKAKKAAAKKAPAKKAAAKKAVVKKAP